MVRVLQWVTPFLPDSKPRHLLGVGEIDDVFALIEYGIDTFDCVQPTRLARMGKILTRNTPTKTSTDIPLTNWEIDITNQRYKEDTHPIDSTCRCYTCQNFSRAYIHHLFRVRELLGYRLATIHNIAFMNRLIADIRQSIQEGSFLELKKQWI